MRVGLVLPAADPSRIVPDEGIEIWAVDGGGDRAKQAGLAPRVVVGDMDSIEPATLVELAKSGCEILRHPREKLHVDAQIALDEAIRRGAREIVLFGAQGGERFDHAFANVQLFDRALRAGVAIRAVDAASRSWGVSAAFPLESRVPPGTLVSVLALTAHVDGVTLEGFDYPLKDAAMSFDEPYGVSNLAREPVQHVSCRAGHLLVVALDNL